MIVEKNPYISFITSYRPFSNLVREILDSLFCHVDFMADKTTT